MPVKPLTSLALCALALTFAPSAGAVEASATVVVTPPVVKVVHRSRRSTKIHRSPSGKKVVVNVIEHHAEPARTPAVIVTPVVLKKPRVHKEPAIVVTKARRHVKGEIMIGPRLDTKIVVSPVKSSGAKPAAVPAVIEVKAEPARVGTKPVEVSTKGDVKIEVRSKAHLRPVAQKEPPPKDDEASEEAKVTLDVGTGDDKIIAPASTVAKAKEHVKLAKTPCVHDGVEFVRGQEAETFALTRCDGSVAPLAVERLSVLARPDSAPRPKSIEVLSKVKGADLSPGIRRVDPGLVERIEAVAEHFSKPGTPAKVSIISGYRPMSSGSYHATAQALDMRVEGIPNEAVVEFCKSLPDTGCGYYPNSSFVHVDVRQPGTGHVAWIDASGPGEPPRYVASWPPPPDPDVKVADKTESVVEKLEKPEKELPPLPGDNHSVVPVAPSQPVVLSAPLELAK